MQPADDSRVGSHERLALRLAVALLLVALLAACLVIYWGYDMRRKLVAAESQDESELFD
jgi:cell division protein FtsL